MSAESHAPHGEGHHEAHQHGAARDDHDHRHHHDHRHDENRHDHDHDHHHEHGKHAHDASHDHAGHGHGRGSPERLLAIALALTASFFVCELVVGWWSGSLALLADAGHMFGDGGSLALSLVVAHLANRPRSPRKTFGYRRAEVLAALFHAVVIVVAAIWVVVEAVERFRAPPSVLAPQMLVTSVLGLFVNLGAAAVLHAGHDHNMNVRAAFLHVLGDALGSVAAIVAGVALLFGAAIADPIASVVIAVVMTWTAARLVRDATHVLMEGTPQGLDVGQLERTILGTPGVRTVHDLHVWELSVGAPMLTAHVVLTHGVHGTDVAQRVSDRLRELHAIRHVTIQPEAPAPELVTLRRKTRE